MVNRLMLRIKKLKVQSSLNNRKKGYKFSKMLKNELLWKRNKNRKMNFNNNSKP